MSSGGDDKRTMLGHRTPGPGGAPAPAAGTPAPVAGAGVPAPAAGTGAPATDAQAAGTGAPATDAPGAPAPVAAAPAGAPAAPPPNVAPVDPLLGKVLVDRYLIERKLGEGGMGSVYLARHQALDKPVALKLLHAEYARKPDLVQRFLQEARAASKIRHENIIDITDFGESTEGWVFFAMELLDGRDLHDELARARLAGQVIPWTRTGPIFLQICAALTAAHNLGIVHRDLKPENIFLVEWLGHKDFVKLLDFGIAKMTEVGEEGRKLTRTGMLFGTPEYMAPEQARGEKADHRVDVYAMGCILYQLIVGRVPFEADNFMGILNLHLTAAPPTMGHALANAAAPAGLEAIVQKALSKDREHRQQSIEELANEVRRATDGTGQVLATPAATAPGTPLQQHGQAQGATASVVAQQPGAKPKKSNKTLFLVLGAIAALGVGFAVVMGVQKGDADKAPAATPTEGEWEVLIQTEPSGADVLEVGTRKLLGKTEFRLAVTGDEPRKYIVARDGYAEQQVELTREQSGTKVILAEHAAGAPEPDQAVPDGTGDDPVAGQTPADRPKDPKDRPRDRPKDPTDPPKVAKDPPKVTKDPPKVAKDPPKVTKDPPKVTKDPPKVTKDPPKVTKDPPKDPKIGDVKPKDPFAP